MFKFLCKAAGMVAVTALILRLGEAVSNRVCGKQHSIKIIGRPKEAGSIGIIGGADGPTAIFISGRANPQAVSNVFSRLAGVVKARWNRPVSYTHLDVYKRQPYDTLMLHARLNAAYNLKFYSNY